jgi:hypothetical protein
MTIAEISVATSTVAPVQAANPMTAGQTAQPQQEALQLSGFRLTYDPQNRELFLVYTSPESGLVLDQIPGFQTISTRRNSTTAAPANLPAPSPAGGSASGGAEQGGGAPSAAPAPAVAGAPGPGAPGPGAAAAAAVAAASTPVSRGGAVNIAS